MWNIPIQPLVTRQFFWKIEGMRQRHVERETRHFKVFAADRFIGCRPMARTGIRPLTPPHHQQRG
jgi:hypothetical protein